MADTENSMNRENGEEPIAPEPGGDSSNLGGSIDPQSIEGIFLRAVQKSDHEKRRSFLDSECGGDLDRRRRVTALLRAYDDAGSFLETPAGGPRPTVGGEISLDFLKASSEEGCLGTIGPYRVLETIGRGGMGIVMRASDPKLNRIVAVKVLLPELARNPNARRRFLREAQAAAAISHPHVVTIHAVEEAKLESTPPRPPYLVMECVVGQSLQEKLNSIGPFRLAEILRISRQIAEGLAAAHQQGLIHRDIKPANILLENGVERVTITDFGLARAVDDIDVTITGEVSGTPQYMSPEQASGKRIDHRSDLFSLGCVMYAMCTGHSPFRGNHLAHVIQRVTQDEPRSITDQNPEIPPWLQQIIACLLEKNPEHRFDSAEGLVAILDQHLSRLQQPTPTGSHSLINQSLPTAALPTSEQAGSTQPRAERESSNTGKDSNVDWHGSATRQQIGAQYGALMLAAITLGAVLSFSVISARLIRDNLPVVEARLVEFLSVGVVLTLLGVAVIWLKHGASPMTKLRAGQFTLFLGTVVASLTWTTFLRSPGASRHDYQVLAFITLCWIGFCIYVANIWIAESEPVDASGAKESIHSRVGRRLIMAGLFSIVLPISLVIVGSLLGDGDVMQFGGEALVAVSLTFAPLTIVAGYLLRYIVDQTPLNRPPLKLAIPCLTAISIALAGGLLHSQFEQRTMDRANATSRPRPAIASIPRSPVLLLEHPAWKIRVLSINGLGSTRSEISDHETRLTLGPELLGTAISVHAILLDGREYTQFGVPIERLRNTLTVTDEDLQLRDRALVEVVEDAPGVSLRMIKYPSQHVIKNEFSITKAPFHKALERGEHLIVLDFVRDDWDLPEGMIQYQTLEYRVTVPDANPIKLSLNEILEAHSSRVQTHKLNWSPAYTPLP